MTPRAYPGETAATAHHHITEAADTLSDQTLTPAERAHLHLAIAQTLLAHATYTRITEIKTTLTTAHDDDGTGTDTQRLTDAIQSLISAIDGLTIAVQD